MPDESSHPETSRRSVARTRRRLGLFSLPVVLLAVFVAWKLLSMPMYAGQAMDAYDRGQYDQSAEASDALMFLNVAEDWIPYFNRGTAFSAGESYSQGTDDLAKALERAPDDRRCDVRVNLALAWEMQGDAYFAAGYFAGAIQLYETAKAVIDAGADEGCFEESPPEEQSDPQQPEDSAERLQQADQRITDKLGESERQQGRQDPDGVEASPDDGSGDKVDELRDRGDQAEEERQNQDANDRGQENGGEYVQKPW